MAWEPDYTDLAAYKHFARIDDADTQDDDEITVAIPMVSRAIDRQAGRQFGQTATAVAAVYTPRYSWAKSQWYVETEDMGDVTGLSVQWDSTGDRTYATTVDASDYVLWPYNAAFKGRPYERIYFTSSAPVTASVIGVRVTVKWGWVTVPTGIVGATHLQINRIHNRRDAPFGVAGSPDSGSEMRLLAKLDPDVVVAVRPYARRAWVR